MNSFFTNCKVVELTDKYGSFCGKMFAAMGSEVILVEPPKGHYTRHHGPVAEKGDHKGEALDFAFLNTGKKSVVIDLETEVGRANCLKLVAGADVVITSLSKKQLEAFGVDYAAVSAVNPAVIYTSITPFGAEGPYSDYKAASEIIPDAFGGSMYEFGNPGESPVTVGNYILTNGASVYAYCGALAALYGRLKNGKGRFIDISLQDMSVCWRDGCLGVLQSPPGAVLSRRKFVLPLKPSGIYRCKEGKAMMIPGTAWAQLIQWAKDLGIDTNGLDAPEYAAGPPGGNMTLWAREDEANELVSKIAANYTPQKLMEEGQERHIPTAAMATFEGVFESPHFRERGMFKEVDQPNLGKYDFTGLPFHFSKTECDAFKPAPVLGADTEAVLASLPETLEKKGEADNRNIPPLDGLTVLDFGWVIAGGHSSRQMADLGATIIKIETSKPIDNLRVALPRAGVEHHVAEGGWTFQDQNRNKFGTTLNLKSKTGRELFIKLLQHADIVTCNYSPRGLRKLGLSYEDLVQYKKDIIVLNASGMGDFGPASGYVTFAPIIHAICGMLNAVGYKNEEAFAHTGMHADYVGGALMASSLLTALLERSVTGVGEFIDIGQGDGLVSCMGTQLLDWAVNGIERPCYGNSDPYHKMIPHGCYKSVGDDMWCVIAVENDAEWAVLREAMRADGISIADYATLDERFAHEDEIDSIVNEWTQKYTPYEVTNLLQGKGVSAAPVQSSKMVLEDENLKSKNFFRAVSYPRPGTPEKFIYTGITIPMSDADIGEFRTSPFFGQDTEYILKKYLNVTDEELAEAEADKAFDKCNM